MSRDEIVALLGLGFSLALNVIFGLAVLHGRAIGSISTVVPVADDHSMSLHKGDHLTTANGRDLDGNASVVDFANGQSRTLLYILQPDCPWCRRNEPAFAALIRHIRGLADVVVVSLRDEGLTEYVKTVRDRWDGVPVRVLAGITQHDKTAMKLIATPEMFLVSPTGLVEEAWYGAFDSVTGPKVEAFFHVQLPALLPEPAADDDAAAISRPIQRKSCLDSAGRSFGVGFTANIGGTLMRCGADGSWSRIR